VTNAREPIACDVPEQLFLDFVENKAQLGAHALVQAPCLKMMQSPQPKQVPPAVERPASPFKAALPASEHYMTESRAAELFLHIAHEHRSGQIRHADVIFKPFRSTLYSFKILQSGSAHVKMHIAFRKAPEIVLIQAMHLMLRRRRSDRSAIARAEYDTFVRAIPPADFELPGARRGRRLSFTGPGRCRSLEESFQRVNNEYFHSKLEQPELCWSPVAARRVLGSYQERKDRLIISQVFDSPKVPLFVLDYLMYHELLHKFLGIGRRSDGKRCMHGPEFRAIETQFRYYKEAQQFLKRLPH